MISISAAPGRTTLTGTLTFTPDNSQHGSGFYVATFNVAGVLTTDSISLNRINDAAGSIMTGSGPWSFYFAVARCETNGVITVYFTNVLTPGSNSAGTVSYSYLIVR